MQEMVLGARIACVYGEGLDVKTWPYSMLEACTERIKAATGSRCLIQ